MSLRSALVSQFRRPTGSLGALAGWIMANRPSNIARNRWTVELLDLDPSDVVLEIGCGPGLALSQVASIVQQGRVIGIDHSPVMVRQASQRLAGAIRLGRVSVRCMAVEEVPALGLTFDKIYSANVTQFFADPVATFQTLYGCLKPGGLIASTHQPRNKGASPKDAARAADKLSANLLAAGFKGLRREVLDLSPSPAICLIGGA